MDILQTITNLSHEFGTSQYVCGGGGNTSCKDDQTLWVKPSGTTLATLTPDSFVAIDRGKLSQLYQLEPPDDPSKREALVKRIMEQAVLANTPGRASVEAPLHDSLQARYVVHTHPAVVNGMTCSKHGAKVCKRLFPQALWLDYIDPGYTLCMQVRKEIEHYRNHNGSEPAMIFLKNHGVFVSADNPEDVHRLYLEIMSKLKSEYESRGIALELEIEPFPEEDKLTVAMDAIRQAFQNSELSISASGFFAYAVGPISPDHIVYSKSYPYTGQPTVETIQAFKAAHGYLPQVIAFNHLVFGVTTSEKGAKLALELAKDGALVQQFAQAFGGIEYLTDDARMFIENWEVETYRKKQIK